MVNASLLGLLASAALVAAAPAAPHLESRASCTFTTVANLKAGKSACTTITISNMAVPAGTTLDLTGLAKGTNVIFEGATTFGYEQWSGPLVSVSGTNIIVTGATGSTLDGNGAKYWDGFGSNSGGKTKPKFFYAHNMIGGSINHIKLINAPVQSMSIDGSSNLAINGFTLDNSAGASLGHNTDAFDIGDSTGITITSANVVNQDDCLAINSGSNIIFTKGVCDGGHGLSIGSVGGRSDNVVDTVHITSSTIKNSQNGVRVKTVSGATGQVKGVTYQDITLSNITKYGIVIQQDYENGSPTGKPTTGVPITGLTVKGVTGTVASSAIEVYILCGSGSCSGWTWSGNTLTGGKKAGTTCKNVPSGVSGC